MSLLTASIGTEKASGEVLTQYMALFAKKDRPKEVTFRRGVRACAADNGISCKIIIPNPKRIRKPQFGRERRCPPVSLELVLMVAGTGWLIRQLFRLIDWIEG